MTTIAKVFKSGNSQAVRLPKKYRIKNDEVFIKKEGSAIILTPKPKSWREFFNSAPKVPVKAEVETFALEQANGALEKLRNGKINGAAVLVMDQ